MPKVLGGTFYFLGQPIWYLKNNFSSYFPNTALLIRSKSDLESENQKLKGEVSEYDALKANIAMLQQENDGLKEMLGRHDQQKNKNILANVLLKPSLTPYDTFIIDIGGVQEIEVNDKVLVSGNIAIGFISRVFTNTSEVTLYSSNGIETDVSIGSNNITLKAYGRGGGNLIARVPKESEIKIGDVVTFPGSSVVFSTVEFKESRPTDSFDILLFKNPVNENELKYVEVMKSAKAATR